MAPEKIWATTGVDTESAPTWDFGSWDVDGPPRGDPRFSREYTRDDIMEARIAAAYARGLEDAAKVAEGNPFLRHYTQWPAIGDGNRANDSEMVSFARHIAAAIRALEDKQ